MSDFATEWMRGFKAYRNSVELCESHSDDYASGWEAAKMQLGVIYEMEQRDTARSVANGH